jgi:hypothetical protein
MLNDQGDIFNIDYRIGAAGAVSRYKAIPGALKKNCKFNRQ